MRKIEENLCSATEQLIKKDTYENILHSLPQHQNERKMIMSLQEVKKKNKGLKYIGLAVAACLLLVVGLFGGNYYANNRKVDSRVFIDVNPSVEITANRQDKVLDVDALNEDAEEIIEGLELEGIDVETAVSAVIGKLYNAGYLKDNAENEILVSVKNADKAHAALLEKNINAEIASSLKGGNAKATVIHQQVKASDEEIDLAQKHNISIGKASFILGLIDKDPSLKADELAKLSIHELALLVSEKKLDISDFAEYEKDESTKENVEEIIEEKDEDIAESSSKPASSKPAVSEPAVSEPEASNSEHQNKRISPEKATKIALRHAGVKKSDAIIGKAKLEYDDGRESYEIEFYANNYDNDYDIDALSGAVIESNKDYDDDGDDAPVVSQKPDSSKPSNGSISRSAAERIALAHAKDLGASANVKIVEIEKDDGKYELELRDGNKEYSYEIGIKSGKVIDYEIDIDDDDD